MTPFDPMTFGKAESGKTPEKLDTQEWPLVPAPKLAPPSPPPRDGEEQNIYPSGYMRSKAPSWHLLYEPFLAAMVRNMMRGEKIDGPGNPPNYLKATPAEDQYTIDHLRQHLSDAINGENVEGNLVSIASNAMIAYHCLQHRKAQCKS